MVIKIAVAKHKKPNVVVEETRENGTCSRAVSGPGAVCTERCGCQKGYTCYRTVTGFCCPPTTCWEAEKARIDREYWQNCSKDPDCHFPPSVNPGGQGIGGLK
ncbi:hypothetical protein MAR_014953 [Mya arenaria]|uniref:Uncharacterized protein n=1 Tax=Mya arenaria TaxID=6604 RepID=A0ABY7FII2_MYAAR|nr:hypothetical protein MAR_014953 [Mya arenaria]